MVLGVLIRAASSRALAWHLPALPWSAGAHRPRRDADEPPEQARDFEARTTEGDRAMSVATEFARRLAKTAAIVLTLGSCPASPGFAATWHDLGPLCQRNQEACAM